MNLIGFLELFMGLLVFVSHQVWNGWPLIITLFGLGMVLEGAFYLIFPEFMHGVKKRTIKNKSLFITGGIAMLLIGGFLLYKGLMF